MKQGDLLDGRYLIGAPIARGGMSTVFRAVDTRLDREVAAKIMDPRFVDDVAFRTRFEREARAAATINDNTVVRVYDQGTDAAGHVFLIMELVDGGTLRELLRERGPMPPHAAVAVLRPVLHALSLAHGRGMVHRDIKPENVLITDQCADGGRVKLADFGLVRAIADSHVTSNSVIVGTVAYLSPEQVTGGSITPASDVYSAGVLLYELLTGQTPFSGDHSLGVAMQRVQQPMPLPSEAIAGVPAEFDHLVAQACALTPGDRFADAGQFLTALNDAARSLQLPPFTVPVPNHSAAKTALMRAEGFAPTPGVGDGGAGALNETRADLPAETRVDGGAAFTPAVAAGSTGAASARAAGSAAPQPAPTPTPGTAETAEQRFPTAEQRRKHVEKRQRTRLGCALWLIIALVAIFAMALGAWWLGSGRYGEVPTVTGMSEPQATAEITQAGFEVERQENYHDDIPEAQVIGTDPPAGDNVVRGNSINLLISAGKPTVPYPPGDGSASNYLHRLQERTLVQQIGESEYSDEVPAGSVVSTTPPPGTVVDVGSTVQVHLSKGPAPVKIPFLHGMEQQAAVDKLESLGLKVAHFEYEFAPSDAPGTVLEHTPGAGSEVARGTDVTLVINSGIEVPRVHGKSEAEAREILERAGMRVTEVVETSNTSLAAGKVERTTPGAGDVFDPENPEVTLYVSNRVEVPNLLGKNVDEARELLEERGLRLDVSNTATDDDIVFTQSPLPGRKVSAGDTVRVRGI